MEVLLYAVLFEGEKQGKGTPIPCSLHTCTTKQFVEVDADVSVPFHVSIMGKTCIATQTVVKSTNKENTIPIGFNQRSLSWLDDFCIQSITIDATEDNVTINKPPPEGSQSMPQIQYPCVNATFETEHGTVEGLAYLCYQHKFSTIPSGTKGFTIHTPTASYTLNTSSFSFHDEDAAVAILGQDILSLFLVHFDFGTRTLYLR